MGLLNSPQLLFDRFIDVIFYASGEREVLRIETSKSGLKPTMSMDVQLIPGQSCYQCVLRIVNLNIPVIDLQDIEEAVITAGYLTYTEPTGPLNTAKSSMTIKCPVFSAYVEKPNPDGITVINCLCVGTITGAFEARTIPVHIYRDVSWQELIKAIFDKVGAEGYSDVLKTLPPEVLSARIVGVEEGQKNCYATSGYALIMWLGREIYNWGKNCTPPLDIRTIVFDRVVKIINVSPDAQSSVSDAEFIVDLDMVNSASFTGTALDVEAPWNPSLLPGGLFYMPAAYYSAEKNYREINRLDYVGSGDLYRVITMSISFNTVEDTNTMQVRALPVQYLPNNFNTLGSENIETEVDQQVSQYQKTNSALYQEVSPLIIGTKPEQAVPPGSIWEKPLTGEVRAAKLGDYDKLPSVNTWAKAARATYDSHIITAEESVKYVEKLSSKLPDIKNVAGYTIPADYYWPLIVHATYQRWNNPNVSRNDVFVYANPGVLNDYDQTMTIWIPTSTNNGKAVLEAYYDGLVSGDIQQRGSNPILYLLAAYLPEVS